MQLESIALFIGHNQLVTIAFNFIVAFLHNSKAILVVMIFPSDKHYFIVVITTNFVCGDMRSDVTITVKQLNNICRFNKVKSFLEFDFHLLG